MSIYFDNSATTRPTKAVVDAVAAYMYDSYYNPSSMYAPAVGVAADLKRARTVFANDMRVAQNEIIFNSGGTEGNNTVIYGVAAKARRPIHAVTSVAEHSSVYEAFQRLKEQGHTVTFVGTDEKGRVRIDEVMAAIRPETALVSIMHVNNESGAINDIAAIARAVRNVAPGCFIHSDGVQAYPKLPFPGSVDAYTVSGHKFHAPRGTGLLYLASPGRMQPLLAGGGQQNGLRCGTENAAGYIGMGVAAQEYITNREAYVASMQAVKSRMHQNLLGLEGVRVNGPDVASGAPHILSLGFAGVRGETLLHALEEKEIYVGTGSACSSHKHGPSRVIAAMHVPREYTEGIIRLSFCHANTLEEADIAADAIIQAVRRIRRFKKR